MATFHNPTNDTQNFSIGGRDYSVAAGQNVEIPDQFVYVVRSRGMALRAGPSPEKDATTAKPAESLPDRVTVLFSSPHVRPSTRASFTEAWAKTRDQGVRSKMIEQLERIAEGRAPNADDDDVDNSGTPPVDDAAETPAETDVEAQLGAAEAVAGRRRAPKG